MNYFFLNASALRKRYVIEIGTELMDHLFNSVPKERMVALVLMLGEIVSILVCRKNGSVTLSGLPLAPANTHADHL